MWCRPGSSRLEGNLSSSAVGNLLICRLWLYRSINKVEDTAALQNDMAALQQWESDWQMMFHPEKCTTIHISKKRNPIHTGYKLHGRGTDNFRKVVDKGQEQKWAQDCALRHSRINVCIYN
jgi:hypothetical protein